MGIIHRKPYIYDTQTKNISFLQTSVDLAKLGIKNNKFFLKLYDQDLQGIDPYSPYLTDELRFKIVTECIRNPWYFLREVCRIPDQGAGAGIPYQLHRANLAITWCFVNGIDSYLTIPRQTGKTMSILAIIEWSFLYGTSNSDFLFFNKSQEDANANLARLKALRKLLPPYLQFNVDNIVDENGKKLKDTDNVKKVVCAGNGNTITTKPSARTKDAADKLGRGSTTPLHYYDEVEFTDWIAEIVEAAGPAFNTASKNAKRNNSAYGRLFSSTPGDLDSNAGQQAMQILEKTYKWSEKFYDMNPEKVKEIIAANSDNRIVYIEYSYIQLGKDENWFRDTCVTVNNNPAKVRREILLQRMRGSSDSPFDEEDLLALQELKPEPIEEYIINEFYKLDVYKKIDRDISYIIGVDVSNGYGQDNTAVTVLNPYTLEVDAEFKSSLISTTNLKKFLFVLVRKYFPKCILAIERNHNGESVISDLRETTIAPNLYYDNTKDPMGSSVDAKIDNKGFLVQEAEKRKLFGVWTGTKSRKIMMDLLETKVKEEKEKFTSRNVIEDILNLVIKNGKIQANAGSHDDCVMSYLVALYVFYYGKNLHRYGLIKGYKPGESEQNKGLIEPETIMDMLSENDRQAMGTNIGSKTYEDYARKIAQEQAMYRREVEAFEIAMNSRVQVQNFNVSMDQFNALDASEYVMENEFLDMFNDLNGF